MTSKGKTSGKDESAASDRDTLHDEHPPFDLRRTLPTGAAFKQTWKLPVLRPSGSPPADPTLDTSRVSGVRRMPEATTPTLASSDLSRGQTLISMVPGVAMPAAPSELPTRHSVFQQNEPRDTLEPAIPTEALSATRRAALSGSQDTVLAASVQRIGEAQRADTESTRPSARATDPFGHPAQRVMEAPQREAPAPSAAPSAPSLRPSGRPQPSAAEERRLSTGARLGAVLSIAALLAALALLFFATEPVRQAPSSAADPGSAPNVVTPAPLKPAPPAAPAAANVTELWSEPANAEVVLSGAVVANTPARIARGTYEADYLVRLPGYDPQLIRIGPKSPAQITVRLLPLVAEPTK